MVRIPCKYVVVRYVPDVVRDEPINVGVILQGPDGQILSRFPDRVERVERLPSAADITVLRSTIEGIKELVGQSIRLTATYPDWGDLLANWAADLANQVVFTRPRTTIPVDLEAEIEDLYSRFVSEVPVKQAATAVHDAQLRAYVKHHLAATLTFPREYEEKIHEDYTVSGIEWPDITVSFAFRNGRVNLANTISLAQKDVGDVVAKVKIWETNYRDLSESGTFDQAHLYTILHVPDMLNPELRERAKRVLGRLTQLVPDDEQHLWRFANMVRETAKPWKTDDIVQH